MPIVGSSGGPDGDRGRRVIVDRLVDAVALARVVAVLWLATGPTDMRKGFNGLAPGARATWLADVLARINDLVIHRLDELLPWNWAATMERRKMAA